MIARMAQSCSFECSANAVLNWRIWLLAGQSYAPPITRSNDLGSVHAGVALSSVSPRPSLNRLA